ncbi:hypothetical protein FA13DRAFT_1527740 [Coprinellus micaceus]|uniref:Uncharacterized protein n=1 Tax=Coprinellus micaceus TaxID=71717 RepID=A0A4Y7SL61_COPMI|nr:hypothetical protein FA13DRAFT_1527740 [Coprinellus micaceus]
MSLPQEYASFCFTFSSSSSARLASRASSSTLSASHSAVGRLVEGWMSGIGKEIAVLVAIHIVALGQRVDLGLGRLRSTVIGLLRRLHPLPNLSLPVTRHQLQLPALAQRWKSEPFRLDVLGAGGLEVAPLPGHFAGIANE